MHLTGKIFTQRIERNNLTLRTRIKRLVGLNKLEVYGIGSFFMNEIVKWVKQWPESNVKPIALTDGLATPDNKERRDRFYEKFGLEFEYSSPERASGYSRVMLARDLVSFDSPPPNCCFG